MTKKGFHKQTNEYQFYASQIRKNTFIPLKKELINGFPLHFKCQNKSFNKNLFQLNFQEFYSWIVH